MAELVNVTQNQVLVRRVIEARSFYTRLRGLLGQTHWPTDQALWIHHCNSVHTFFMKFSIDLVFVNRRLEVQAVFRNVKPWRLIPIVWGANSVFELAAGSPHLPQKGDQLNVRT